jgi:hypothetical protein
MPYTYLIGWKGQNLWYYGVRYASGCKPEELWKKYKTSSRYVAEAVSKYGDPDVIQIRKTFTSKKAAMRWEHKVLRRLNAVFSERWLNKTDNVAIDYHGSKRNTVPGMEAARQKLKGKTYEEIYGPEKAAELKALRSASRKGKSRVEIHGAEKAAELTAAISEKRRGKKVKPRTPEQCEMYRQIAIEAHARRRAAQ